KDSIIPESDKDKTSAILQALHKYYSIWRRERKYIVFPELRLGSGYSGTAQRRIDFFVISSCVGNETTAFEIKVSKKDFKKDINNDLKQRGARLYANKFYYVTPKGLLSPEEKKQIPIWAGLLEYDFEKNSRCYKNVYFDEVIPAPLHAKAMPSWGLICAITRKVKKLNGYD
ncbi:MAG: hypothetical protein IJH34_05905, partial [Romboutsia sp.]|nr:hypothetical protein [Romboutsia sp.]